METMSVEANFRTISVFQNAKKVNRNNLKTNELQNMKGFQSFIFCNPLVINSIQILPERSESRDYFQEKRFVFGIRLLNSFFQATLADIDSIDCTIHEMRYNSCIKTKGKVSKERVVLLL